MLEDEQGRLGLSPEAARAAARREFGGVEQAKENYRWQRGLPLLESLIKDVRYAARGLRRKPGFAAAAILSLALGVGANASIFSLFHALLLRRLPVDRPEQLVSLYKTGGWGRGFLSYPLYLDLRARTDLFDGALARSGVRTVRFNRSGEPALLDFPRAYKDPDRQRLQKGLLDRIGAMRGVLSVSLSAPGPYLGGFWHADIRVPGSDPIGRVLSFDDQLAAGQLIASLLFGVRASDVRTMILASLDPIETLRCE